ncbi:Zinc finger CCCH-type with G patch domain-containing protein [Rhynchospora pubera]|uniref:Zinc finger CCCH-type with G patch domain-containing protein n=1 Tax=Rhynchospora pubera TaxID=906938 RepID=A0AAV8CGL6_9POAL|nr:Zinc finger CCCH-type with G patch domain-containing protein [Rhynchospora pubera]
MANDSSSGEEAELEQQLEQQLEEQKASLDAVNEALASDPSNSDLLEVRKELLLAIKDAEEGLLHLKRSRLLKQIDAVFPSEEPAPLAEDIKVEPLDLAEVEPEDLQTPEFSVGSKCRFRHRDGRWYNGQIIGFENDSVANVSFLNPTSENMTMCRFFLQKRCRFGASCRMSHGLSVPISLLKQYIPTEWHKSLVGSTILAAAGPSPSIWKRAELESWDKELELGEVVFCEDGATAKLGTESLSLSRYAELREEDYDDDSDGDEDDYDDSNDDDDDDEEPSSSGKYQYSNFEEDELGHQGLGLLEATNLQKGVQTETRVFAKWEHHTRGIASKIMANMGYREGMGLGVSGQGKIEPIQVKVLPPKQSLDLAVATEDGDWDNKRSLGGKSKGGKLGIKRRTRGGRRKREKKFAEMVRAQKAEEQQSSDVFNLINNQLVSDAKNGSSGSIIKFKRDSGDKSNMDESRRSLVAYNDEVTRLKNIISKWEEMASRNQKDKAMYEAAMRKLSDVRKELSDAEARCASVFSAVSSKEKEKKWLKF